MLASVALSSRLHHAMELPSTPNSHHLLPYSLWRSSSTASALYLSALLIGAPDAYAVLPHTAWFAAAEWHRAAGRSRHDTRDLRDQNEQDLSGQLSPLLSQMVKRLADAYVPRIRPQQQRVFTVLRDLEVDTINLQR